MEKVMVTGATGYIGLHCIDQLLKQGYAVNGSIRSPEREEEVFQALQKFWVLCPYVFPSIVLTLNKYFLL